MAINFGSLMDFVTVHFGGAFVLLGRAYSVTMREQFCG